MNNILFLPVKPKWANQIMSGEKTLELRKRLPLKGFGKKCVIYSSSPRCEIIGTCVVINNIYGVLRRSGMSSEIGLRLVPQSDLDAARVTRAEFASYFGDRQEWFGMVLGSAVPFAKPISLKTMRAKWRIEPPQQWRYINETMLDEIVKAAT